MSEVSTAAPDPNDDPNETPVPPPMLPEDDPVFLRAERDAAREDAAKWKRLHDEGLIEREVLAAGRKCGMAHPEQLKMVLPPLKVVDGKVVGASCNLPLDKLVGSAQADPQHANIFAKSLEELQAVLEGKRKHAGKIDVRTLTPEQYRQIRKDDPGALGLRPY